MEENNKPVAATPTSPTNTSPQKTIIKKIIKTTASPSTGTTQPASVSAPKPASTTATTPTNTIATQTTPNTTKPSISLNKYLVDYTNKYKQGTLKKTIGREEEIERLIHVMLRNSKNNPILVGENGIGKTSIVEAIATKLAKGDVPDLLKGASIVYVDVAAMLIDSKNDAQYEERLKSVFQKIVESKGKLIVFIKDPNTLNLGDPATREIAKFLKPKIISGEIKCIITSDLAKYKIYVENDFDLIRCIQPIYIEEATTADALDIVMGVKDVYEKFYNITIPEEPLKAVIALSGRYIKQKPFPEKAIDLLDEACSYLVMQLTAGKIPNNERVLKTEHVSHIIFLWTGIPTDKVEVEDKKRLINMEDFIAKRVIGQPEAVEVVCNAVKISRAGLQDPNRPIGSYMFVGTTGVGKTELAKALAEFVFDDDTALLRIDMSEYMERQSISRLLGPPPGSPGYEEGGLLTEAVRRKPYQVVLFDEIEKANIEILNLFLQILDEGRLTDTKGITVDFRNTIVILTSNLGAGLPGYKMMDFLKQKLKPEILARIDDIVPFNDLGMNSLSQIVALHLNKLVRLVAAQGITLELPDSAILWLAEKVYSAKNGVREIRTLMKKHLQSTLSEMILHEYISAGDSVIAYEGESHTKPMRLYKLDRETGEPINEDFKATLPSFMQEPSEEEYVYEEEPAEEVEYYDEGAEAQEGEEEEVYLEPEFDDVDENGNPIDDAFIPAPPPEEDK